MNGQNDLYHYLHNPDEYAKQKEYIKKKKLLYGDELRLQIEENNRIKNQIGNPAKRLKFPKITNNNKNSFYLQNYNDISKDNNENNNYSELINNNNNNQNFNKTLTQNFPNILNQKHINDNNNINDINTNIINDNFLNGNDNFLNGNDLNIQKIFNNFVENQINAIDNYISNVDKIINISKENGLDNKNNDVNDRNDINKNNEIKNNNIYYNRDNENINQMKKMIDKEKKKVINNINLAKEKLKNKLGYFPEEVNYNKRIEELFNKIMNKKIAKYSSISPRKNSILNINKDNSDINENNLNINNNSEKNLNNNTDNINNNDKENNTSNNFESNSNNILDFSCNYNENNNNNVKNKNIDSNKDNQNNFMDNHTNINIKNNNSNNGSILKPSKNKFLNIESNNQNYDFAFKNNSFNNNLEANKSFKSEEVNDDNLEDKSLPNSNSNQKEEDNNDDDEYLSNNSNKNEDKNKNKKSFILSKKDNIMDIFSRNEKNRIKKFSEVYKINNNKKYKENRTKKNTSKKTFTLPVNQNFKSIKNISKDITLKTLKAINNNNILAQKSNNFFRTRSKSYKAKKVNIKLKKKTDNSQNDNIMSDYYNRNNSKNLSYSYNDLNLKNKLNVDKKINISHNNDNIKEKRNKIPRKKKVSIQKEETSGMVGNTEPNTLFGNKSNRSIINFDKRYNLFQKRSSSYAQDKNTKIYPLDKVEYRQSKTMNALRNRSESSFIAGMNVLNNQFLPNIMFDRGNDRDDDRLYRMIKNFEESVKERIRIEEGKDVKQIQVHRTNNIYSNNYINSNMNINNILFRNSTKTFGEVELIPKKYIFRCKKIIYPEIESEKIKEREKLLFGKK